MTLKRRLGRLESVRGEVVAVPNVIILRAVYEPGGEDPALVAMVLRGPNGPVHLERDEGETEAAFELRARAAANAAGDEAKTLTAVANGLL